MRISQLRLHEGQRIPTWYGASYVDHVRYEAVYHPIPINLIVRAGRWLQMSFIFYCNRRAWDLKLYEVRNAGWRDGFLAGCAKVREEIVNSPVQSGHLEQAIQTEVNRRLHQAIVSMRRVEKQDALSPDKTAEYPENITLNEGF